MKLSPSLMLKHQETINLQTSGKDFFPPLLLNQVELHQQAGARKESHGEELENIPSEMLFMRDASIAFAKHPKAD